VGLLNVVVVDNLSNSCVTVFDRVEQSQTKKHFIHADIRDEKNLGGIFEITKI
jgi:UDP-glucose 4-epimerase